MNKFLKIVRVPDLIYQVINLETNETVEFKDIYPMVEFCRKSLGEGWDGYRMVQEKIGENSWWVLPYLG
jgi:hypothetical protein